MAAYGGESYTLPLSPERYRCPAIDSFFIMIPIQDLLHRIQWDPGFADGDFEIAYYDSVEERLIRVPMTRVRFEKDSGFVFELFDHEGAVHMIPLHRVREVYKDGRRIWSRKG